MEHQPLSGLFCSEGSIFHKIVLREHPFFYKNFISTLTYLKLFFRQLVKHVFQTYLPTFIIVFVSWLSFLVPPAAYPGRMGMLVVLVLVIINIMLKVVEMSPMTSGICGLTLWTIMCLIMVVQLIYVQKTYDNLLCFSSF